jgi:putative toxin-antitoxin system antitoxin component (TIGR02293 family)
MSEREARLLLVTATAEDVWNDQADARDWLNKTHPELDYRTPLEAAATEAGARRVEEILGELRYGIPG